jgi:hypothetical protein
MNKTSDFFYNWKYPILLGVFLLLAGPSIISFLSLLSTKLYITTFGHPKKFDSATTGTIGDTMGGTSGPFIALFAGYLSFIAFRAQILANRDVQRQFSSQQFEAQFFEMIRLHRENVGEMKITGYILLSSTTEEVRKTKTKKIVTSAKTERIVEARKAFVSMAKEMRACYEFCEIRQKAHKIPDSDLFKIAYELFFFGSFSTLVNDRGYPKFLAEMRKDLQHIRQNHKDSVGTINEFKGLGGKEINLHIKYAPFTGHESRLGHYYRHLFAAVRFVVDKEKEGVFSYSTSREYLKILRVQLSNDENLMLYYNYLSDIGANWESMDNSLFIHYRMLHNLPTGRLRIVERPQVAWKDKIAAYKVKHNIKDDLFEWGDR